MEKRIPSCWRCHEAVLKPLAPGHKGYLYQQARAFGLAGCRANREIKTWADAQTKCPALFPRVKF